MKNIRRNFLKLIIIKFLILSNFTKSFSIEKTISKRKINKRIFRKYIWYLDENDK